MNSDKQSHDIESEDFEQVHGGIAPLDNPYVKPVEPPLYYTQEEGEDGNWPPAILW